ncbi:hypothetical protein AWB81_01853 [Caballeronia arationis]|uniref:hypothetical protein n=1 Tax=Caballeronia arationis TaxID=1777142 RepID=UPI00074D228B|nr:hypothetical protein [Caballeronia arationis]SAK59488.1 hypothetical protein AWB81_01853 [Caballeronia arationis]
MTTHERERGRVRLYACGGAGVNVGHKVDRVAQSNDEAFAQLDVVYIDTSKSNLHSDIKAESVYLIDGLDGSGQVRRENHGAISERVRDILQTFKPVDLNIVLSSAGGGSGSVIAPSIVSELLAKDYPTIVICVGDDSTKKYSENTLNTLKSYDQIASTVRQQPVIMSYLQNSADMTRPVVDQRVQHLVAALCLLFSRRNRELDSKDLYNWLHYQKVTSYKPALTALTLIEDLNATSLSKIGNLISIATLTMPDVDPSLSLRPEVQYVGYIEGDTASDKLNMLAPFHYVTSDGVFAEVAAGLNTVLRELEEQTAARLNKAGISTSADQATDTGLVL